MEFGLWTTGGEFQSMNNKKYITLKNRMMNKMALLLLTSLVISTFISLSFSFVMTRNRILNEEQEKLVFISQQYTTIVRDISSFLKYIASDDEMVRILEIGGGTSTFEHVKYRDTIKRKLVHFNSMRIYIWATFIDTVEGGKYGSKELVDDDYYSQKFEYIPELKAFQEDNSLISSSPYTVEDQLNPGKVICFRQDIWDTKQYGKKLGTIYVEVYEQLLINPIIESNLDKIVLVDINGSEVYAKGLMRRGTILTEVIDEIGWSIKTTVTWGDIIRRSTVVIIFFVLSFALSFSFIMYLTNKLMFNFTKPITKLAEHMRNIDENTVVFNEIVETGDEIEILYSSFKGMIDSIHKGLDDRIKLEKETKDAEFAILMSQIHPHYLYNVLNTIIYLSVMERNSDVVNITHALIDTLQKTLGWGSGRSISSIDNELELTENYITIQKYRFINKFKVQIHCEEKLKYCLVPNVIIQPLVDNALIHGINEADIDQGTIEIKIFERREDNGKQALIIMVIDDGIGIDDAYIKKFENRIEIEEENYKRKHIGLVNIRDRIEYLYGQPYGISLKKRENQAGTTVLVTLPIIYDKNL